MTSTPLSAIATSNAPRDPNQPWIEDPRPLPPIAPPVPDKPFIDPPGGPREPPGTEEPHIDPPGPSAPPDPPFIDPPESPPEPGEPIPPMQL